MATCIELLLLCDRFGLDPERIIAAVAELADIRGIDVRTVLLAASFIKEKQANVFDALHAASACNDTLISSDAVYDRLGIRRIRLEEA